MLNSPTLKPILNLLKPILVKTLPLYSCMFFFEKILGTVDFLEKIFKILQLPLILFKKIFLYILTSTWLNFQTDFDILSKKIIYFFLLLTPI